MDRSLVYDDIDPDALKAPPRRAQAQQQQQAKREFAIPSVKAAVHSPEDVLNNLVARDLVDPSGDLETLSSTVSLYGALLRGIGRGEDITPLKAEVRRITEHQPEKAAVLLSVLNLIDQERTNDFVVMRANSEKVIKRAATRGDITTQEALVIYNMANRVIAESRVQLTKHVKPVESSTVDKVDHHAQQQDRLLARKYDNTSPQGREIIRKKLYELKKRVRVTVEEETVTEETVPEQEAVDV